MKTMKRVLTLALSLLMVFSVVSMVSLSASAATVNLAVAATDRKTNLTDSHVSNNGQPYDRSMEEVLDKWTIGVGNFDTTWAMIAVPEGGAYVMWEMPVTAYVNNLNRWSSYGQLVDFEIFASNDAAVFEGENGDPSAAGWTSLYHYVKPDYDYENNEPALAPYVGSGLAQGDADYVNGDKSSTTEAYKYFMVKINKAVNINAQKDSMSIGWLYLNGEYSETVHVDSLAPITGAPAYPVSVGYQGVLVTSAIPSTAENTAITWESSNDQVVALTNHWEYGKVNFTAVGNGTATITATSVDGGKTATVDIVIETIGVTGITDIGGTQQTYRVGESGTFTAGVIPEYAENKNISWSSTDMSVLNISPSGAWEALKVGTVTVTATTADGGFTATTSVTVSPKVVNAARFKQVKASALCNNPDTLPGILTNGTIHGWTYGYGPQDNTAWTDETKTDWFEVPTYVGNGYHTIIAPLSFIIDLEKPFNIAEIVAESSTNVSPGEYVVYATNDNAVWEGDGNFTSESWVELGTLDCTTVPGADWSQGVFPLTVTPSEPYRYVMLTMTKFWPNWGQGIINEIQVKGAYPTVAPFSEEDFTVEFNQVTEQLEATFTRTLEGETYQVWAYANTGDAFTWKLISGYGDAKTVDAPIALGTDAELLSDGGVYKVMIIAKGADGSVSNFVKSVVTEEEAKINNLDITKILVGGKEVDGKLYIDLDAGNVPSAATVYVNKANTITRVTCGASTINFATATDGKAATFELGLTAAGTYDYTVKAVEGGVEVAKSFQIVAYSTNNNAAVIENATAAVTDGVATFAPTNIYNATQWNVKIGNKLVTGPADQALNVDFGSAYGVYTAFAYVGKSASSYDDGQDLYINNLRPGATWNLTLSANGTTYTASANTPADVTNVYYQWLREDASGTVVIKDWATGEGANVLNFTTAKPGLYNVMVRVRGNGAGSFEEQESINGIVVGSANTISGATVTLDGYTGAVAKTPVTLTAEVTGTSVENLLYRFDINDAQIHNNVVQAYSPSNTCTWIPRKAGTYEVTVMVRTDATYGIYEIVDTQTVVVG